MRGAALVLAAICPGCGGGEKALQPDQPNDRAAPARCADAAAVEEAISAVQRSDATEILLQGIDVTGADLRRIGQLGSLRTLDLGTQPLEISDDGVLALAGLTELRVLVLGAAPVSDAGLVAIEMANLLESIG